jgi:hypothetical protein
MTIFFIRGCKNNSRKLSATNVKFFCLPSTSVRYSKELNDQKLKRRLAWINNAKQKCSHDLIKARISSYHFHGGK